MAALRLSSRRSGENEALPSGMWRQAVRSRRNSTRPLRASPMARSRSSALTTVPERGFGMSPRGPRIRPRRPTRPIISGVARVTSKSSQPPSMRWIRSSPPMTSAPASPAKRAPSPWAKTAIRTRLPRPWGKSTTLRTCWSACRGSRPVLRCNSSVSSKPAVASSLAKATASAGS